MLYCYWFKKFFPMDDVIYWSRSEQSAYYGCPVCLANGIRTMHLYWMSTRPAPNEIVDTGMGNEDAATDEVAAYPV